MIGFIYIQNEPDDFIEKILIWLREHLGTVTNRVLPSCQNN